METIHCALLQSGKAGIEQEAGCTSGQLWTGTKDFASTELRTPDHSNRGDRPYQLNYPDRTTKSRTNSKRIQICSIRRGGAIVWNEG